MGIIAAAEAATKSSHGSSYTYLILIVLIGFAVYFMMIRPRQRRQQAANQTRNTVTPGARVRTTAGMYATVTAVDGDDVVLEVAPGVEVRYMKRAVMEVTSPGEPEEADAPSAEEDMYSDDEGDYSDDDVAAGDETGSAAEGLASSHDDDLASSDRRNIS